MKNRKLLMIPGPSPVARSIQDQMGRETVAFGDPSFVKDFSDVVGDLRSLWKTSGEVFVVAGSGTLAMEMAIANTTKRGDNVLVVSHGFFGDRFVEICERKGLVVDVLRSEWGKAVPAGAIETKLKERQYRAMTVTHVDTSTGVCANVEEIGTLAKKQSGLCYIVDGVCATGAEREYVDAMGIDILFTGSQKAFGVPPGLAMLWAGPRALERRKELGTIPEYYADFEKWLPVMHDPSKYFATPAVNMVWALKESIRIIREEGLDARCARHVRNGRAIQSALQSIGFGILADAECRASTLSALVYGQGVDDQKFRQTLAEEGVQVSGGLGPYAGKLFRLGHMGNIDMHDLVAVVAAIERTLVRIGRPVESGKGVGVLMNALK
ncbi:MAG TPA: alanine--glyoxylate aminotransferase family protein [Bacteroidota bacterium]